jgi:hypothetical protein
MLMNGQLARIKRIYSREIADWIRLSRKTRHVPTLLDYGAAAESAPVQVEYLFSANAGFFIF